MRWCCGDEHPNATLVWTDLKLSTQKQVKFLEFNEPLHAIKLSIFVSILEVQQQYSYLVSLLKIMVKMHILLKNKFLYKSTKNKQFCFVLSYQRQFELVKIILTCISLHSNKTWD